MGILVRDSICKTCPFRQKGWREIFAGAIKRASRSYLRCHETDWDGLKDEQIQCRGFFDRNLGKTTQMQKEIGLFQFVPQALYDRLKELAALRKSRRRRVKK